MTRTNAGKKNIMLRLSASLLVLVILTTWMTSGLLARYTVRKNGTDDAEVAAFVFNVSVQDAQASTIETILDTSSICVPGDKETYTLVVGNKRGAQICETAQQYTLELQLNGSMPLVCTLQKNSETEQSISRDQAINIAQKLQDQGTFAAKEESSDTYTLTVEWPATANDVKYANGSAVAEVKLSVNSVQID